MAWPCIKSCEETTKNSLFDTLSFIINLLCLSFVIYKSEQCIAKFISKPESAKVSIEDPANHPYPAISICLNDVDSFYAETLKKCNLTADDYRIGLVWGGSGEHEFCQDPEKLYEEMTGDPYDLLISDITGMNETDWMQLSYRSMDDQWSGRCFTYETPKDTQVIMIEAWFWNDADIFVHRQGSFYDDDYKLFSLMRGQSVVVSVMHEVFEVLDFDGQPCKKYLFGQDRDECILDKIHEESMEKLGCTSPYGRNKSNICTDPVKSREAYSLFMELTTWNRSAADAKCPKSCTYQMVSISNFPQQSSGGDSGYLQLNFQKFIKMSKSQYSYTWLELLAEVGGYVGLFLGVSVNQTLSLLKQMFSLFRLDRLIRLM